MKEKWDAQRRDMPIKSKITISRVLLEAERLWASHSVYGSLFPLTSFSLFLAESTHMFTALVILDLSSDSADIVSDIMLTTECFTLSWTVIWNLSANPELNIWHWSLSLPRVFWSYELVSGKRKWTSAQLKYALEICGKCMHAQTVTV